MRYLEQELGKRLSSLPSDMAQEISFRLLGLSSIFVLPVLVDSLANDDWCRQNGHSPLSEFGTVCLSFVSLNIQEDLAVKNLKVIHKLSVRLNNDASPFQKESPMDAGLIQNGTSAIAGFAFQVQNPGRGTEPVQHSISNTAGYLKHYYSGFDFEPYIDEVFSGDLVKLTESSLPAEIGAKWSLAKGKLISNDQGWDIWIQWYERILKGQDWHPEEMWKVLQTFTKEEDWQGDVAEINARFDPVLELYLADESGSGSNQSQNRRERHLQTIRSQVYVLRDFLEVEYRELSGHNSRSETQDELLELLKQLQGLVAEMLGNLESGKSDKNALTVVQENLPAVVGKAGQLALIEPLPQISKTTIVATATIQALVDAGADPKLATQYALGEAATKSISEAAGKKLKPGLRRLLPWWGNNETGT